MPPQVLRKLTPSMFHAVGAPFIAHYNAKYNLAVPWGREWEEQNMAYLQYLLVVQSYNRYHGKFPRSFPQQLQEEMVDRISHNVATPNMIRDPDIQWPAGVDILASIPPVRPLAGFQHLLIHQREQIRQVCTILVTDYKMLCYITCTYLHISCTQG